MRILSRNFNIFGEEHLSEGDMLVEMLCGVIMVLVMIGYLKLYLGQEGFEYQKTIVFVPLGACAAWGIIDGMMYVLLNLRLRGKYSKILSLVRSSKDQNEALVSIEEEIGSTFIASLNKDDRTIIYQEILKKLAKVTDEKPRGIERGDLVVVVSTFCFVFFTGSSLVIPFILLNDPWLAIRISHIIGLVLLFCIGYRWGRSASRNKIRSGIGMIILGIIIVGITELLGG